MKPIPTRSGFTLIEVLVVISIIGVLSAVVLSSFNIARLKAKNIQVLSQIDQYRKALALIYSDKGSYPYLGNTNTQYCLGKAPTDQTHCFNTYGSTMPVENEVLVTELSRYIPDAPNPNREGVKYGSTEIKGSTYRCVTEVNGHCVTAIITWLLHGTFQCDNVPLVTPTPTATVTPSPSVTPTPTPTPTPSSSTSDITTLHAGGATICIQTMR
jgi:prepilin-type N-terminal cleavage/methylation domain-containing protein